MGFTLCACSGTNDDEKLIDSINEFCNKIDVIDEEINNIDPSSEDAPSILLTKLDELDEIFLEFSEIDFPDEYDYMENIADEAAENMSTAVSYYHSTYEGEEYDSVSASYADEYFERAYKRVQIVISLLHGEQPEGVQVIE